jgi:hypothetical protein
LRLTLTAPLHESAVLVAETRSGRLKLDYRLLDDREIETVMPAEALAPAGEIVRLWLSQDGRAAGPAVVRVLSGPLVRRAEWAPLGSRSAQLSIVGEGFGTDPSAVLLTVGDQVWQPRSVADGHVELELPQWRGGPMWVGIEVDGRSSDPVLAREQPRPTTRRPA